MPELSAELQSLIDKYSRGPELLRKTLADFPPDKLSTPLPPGNWSALQVVCHLADFEMVYADRIKAVLSEDGPAIPGRDDSKYAARLDYHRRNLAEELALIELVRKQLTPLLRSLSPADFQRVGIHSVDGPLRLETLLARIAGHIPHHVDFIERKKKSS